MHEGQYRVIYVTKFADAIYVLSAFQKKTQKARKQNIDAAKQTLKQLQNAVWTMRKNDQFTSVWDALEDDPVRQENLKLRSALMMEIAERIKNQGLTQTQAAEVLYITQPRVSALLKGKINDFRLDSLVDMAHRLGMHVSINVAA
jgi:predicted XRE-type DNA-binding protein